MTDQLSDMDLALRLADALGWDTGRYCFKEEFGFHDHGDVDDAEEHADRRACRVAEPAVWTDPSEPWSVKPLAWVLRGDGCMAVLDAMRERGIRAALVDCGESWEVAFHYRSVYYHGNRVEPLPRAVAEAALAALEAE